MEFKDLIKNRRIEIGATLEDIAKIVGVSKATGQRWESGNIANISGTVHQSQERCFVAENDPGAKEYAEILSPGNIRYVHLENRHGNCPGMG